MSKIKYELFNTHFIKNNLISCFIYKIVVLLA